MGTSHSTGGRTGAQFMAQPLSDLSIQPAPASEPPYEDGTDGPGGGRAYGGDGERRPEPAPGSARSVQGTLALSFALPSGAPARPEPPDAVRLAAPSRPASGQRPMSDSRDRAAQPPDRPWACRFVQALVEVLAGLRPVTQLLQWTSPEVYERVKRRAAVPGRWSPNPNVPRRARLHSVRLCRPCEETMEVCAVVRGGGRARAIALRFDHGSGHWRCTQLELG